MDKTQEKQMDTWLFQAFKSGNKKLPPTKEKSRDDEALQYLKNVGLLDSQKKQSSLITTFEGALSAAKSGIAFVPIGAGEARLEAIIPHGERNGALHRDRVQVTVIGFNRGRFTAKVNKVIEPFSQDYLARTLERAPGGGGKDKSLRLAELIDLPDKPHVLVRGKVAAGEVLYLKRTTDTAQFLREHPRGGYARTQSVVFERAGRKLSQDRRGDLERLRLRYMLPEAFEKALIPKKKDIDRHVKLELKNPKRVHVKDRFIFTIDGEDAKDFDDAISVTETQAGFELDVHIADVGFFVTKDSPLFAEALKRGNSYYLAGSVIPMLPEILSNEFCSLKPKTKRLAFSVRMVYDNSGNRIKYELFKSVIYIDKRFTYKDAHKSLAQKKSPLAAALKLSQILIAKRDGDGRIDLNIAEEKAVYDKKGKFVGLEVQARLNSHRLVEECMLSANQAVANYAIQNGVGILHRNHESMAVDKLERLNKYLQKYAQRLKIRAAEHSEIGRVLSDRALDPVRDVFQILLLRSFMQANYMPEAKGHWGLAFREYAHFTSPIRRFADLVTHIELAAHLMHTRKNFNVPELDLYGRETSRLERIAFEAERADKKLLAVRAFADKIGKVFPAWLSGFTPDRLYVTLTDFPAEGDIEAMDVDRKGEIKIIDDFTIFAGKLQKSLALGDKFKVRLLKADALEMTLKFEFAQ